MLLAKKLFSPFIPFWEWNVYWLSCDSPSPESLLIPQIQAIPNIEPVSDHSLSRLQGVKEDGFELKLYLYYGHALAFGSIFPRNDGEENVGRVLRIMVDGIDCRGFGQVLAQWAPGVGINVEAREIATRDVDPDTMPCLE